MSPSHWSMSRLLASEMAIVMTRLRLPRTFEAAAAKNMLSALK
eukprot:COSAG04_NODE_123_length_24709_cov_113.457294_7_plen_43_part_00